MTQSISWIKILRITSAVFLGYLTYVTILLPMYTFADKPTLEYYDSASTLIQDQIRNQFPDADAYQGDWLDKPVSIELTHGQATGLIGYKDSMHARIDMYRKGRTQLLAIAFISTLALFLITSKLTREGKKNSSNDVVSANR